MRKVWHVLSHVGLVALQVANAAVPFVPPPYNIAVAGGLAAIQGAVALLVKTKPAAKPAA